MKRQARTPSTAAPTTSAAASSSGGSSRQSLYGNSFVQQQMGPGSEDGHSEAPGDVGGHNHGEERTTRDMPSARSTGPLGAPTRADVEAADAFVAGGVKGPQAIAPATGLGGFDATYDPDGGDGSLDIAVRGGVNFVDPIRDDGGGRAVAVDPAYAKMATAINALPTEERVGILPEFTWSSDPADRQAWIDRLKTSVQDTWSGKHEFHVHKPGWQWVGADVEVHVNVAARTERNADDHVSIDAVKTPDWENLYSYGLASSVTSNVATDPNDSTMRIASSDVDPRPNDMLDITNVLFATGSASLSTEERAKVRRWARTYAGDPNSAASHAIRAQVEGHTDSVGDSERNMELSQRRMNTVIELLRANGFTDIEGRLDQAAKGETQMREDDQEHRWSRRVMIKIDHPDGAQGLAGHEFGHVFGLGDQYATSDKAGHATSVRGTGAQTGEAAAHDGLARNMLDEEGNAMAGAIYENNDGIMSGGNHVYAEQYSTFHAALQTLSGVSEWALGGTQARPDPATLDAAVAATPTTTPTL